MNENKFKNKNICDPEFESKRIYNPEKADQLRNDRMMDAVFSIKLPDGRIIEDHTEFQQWLEEQNGNK